ncbi:methionine--tRNA ligase [Hamadaea sp. NPDC051192]|uniref:methionine--tRNA ligase n=1 Tax=Hamadaea sp. NPDC051192 TaxID=3154940 RepID=UPI00343A6BCF
MGRRYVTTAIPYVNAEPHLGYALELVQADVLARHARRAGHEARLLTGTDDNALKNVVAARAAGVDTRTFVDGNAARFAALAEPLQVAYDDFVRTSADARHIDGVARLWAACAARGDFYRRSYSGLYCGGCEQFYAQVDLVDGVCPEHGVAPEPVTESNWFFRLSRYQDEVLAAIESGRVRVEPAARRNEVLAFLRGGLSDISVSRPAARSGGWGIPVPGDPSQTVYVWWDALGNYVTALGYESERYRRWWTESDERIHVIGKGIVRFHAVYWLALLLSAGQPLPTTILVHDYLTLNGAKISKSAGATVDPLRLIGRYGSDAVRWWLLRDVARLGDTDFTTTRLIDRADRDLANGLGNLVHRTTTLVRKHFGATPPGGAGGPLTAALGVLPDQVSRALGVGDFRSATGTLCSAVEQANRHIDATRPWQLGDRDSAAKSAVLADLLSACRLIAAELTPFLPDGAARLLAQCAGETAVPAFPRIG